MVYLKYNTQYLTSHSDEPYLYLHQMFSNFCFSSPLQKLRAFTHQHITSSPSVNHTSCSFSLVPPTHTHPPCLTLHRSTPHQVGSCHNFGSQFTNFTNYRQIFSFKNGWIKKNCIKIVQKIFKNN